MTYEVPGIKYVTVEPVDAPVPLPNRTGVGGLKFISERSRVPAFWLETVYFQRRLRCELRVVPDAPEPVSEKPKKPRAKKGELASNKE